MKWLSVVCALGLLVQGAAIAMGVRRFAWAPLHEQTWLRVEARLGGQLLSDEQLDARYHWDRWHRRGPEFWYLNDRTLVLDMIERVERALPPAEQAQVEVNLRTNGREAETWRWPR